MANSRTSVIFMTVSRNACALPRWSTTMAMWSIRSCMTLRQVLGSRPRCQYGSSDRHGIHWTAHSALDRQRRHDKQELVYPVLRRPVERHELDEGYPKFANQSLMHNIRGGTASIPGHGLN